MSDDIAKDVGEAKKHIQKLYRMCANTFAEQGADIGVLLALMVSKGFVSEEEMVEMRKEALEAYMKQAEAAMKKSLNQNNKKEGG